VTSTPAIAAGLSHRIGILAEGSDADVVLWDSHPLQLGATPRKVWIDGILQIPVPSKTGEETHIEIGKGKEEEGWKRVPYTPNWDQERGEAIDWDGLPPLEGRKMTSKVVFAGVKEVWQRKNNGDVVDIFRSSAGGVLGTVVVEGGKFTCVGHACADVSGDATILNLNGGSISPGLMSYGSPLGLEEIADEPSTADGGIYDAFVRDIPRILDDSGGILRAMDALMFGTRNAL